MRISIDLVNVEVPGTLTMPGKLGAALCLYDSFSVRAVAGPTRVNILGPGKNEPRDEENLLVQALHDTLELAGAPLVGVDLTCRNSIIRNANLGADVAAVAGGITSAWLLMGRRSPPDEEIWRKVARLRGVDPIRLAAAFTGGVISQGKNVVSVGSPKWTFTIFIPSYSVASQQRPTTSPAKAVVMALACSGNEEATRQLLWATEPEDLSLVQKISPASVDLLRWLREKSYPAYIPECGPAVISLRNVDANIEVAAVKSGWNIKKIALNANGISVNS